MYSIEHYSVIRKYVFESPQDLELKLNELGSPCEFLVLEKGSFKAFLIIRLRHGIIDELRLKFNKRVMITGDKPQDKIRISYCILDAFSENDFPLVLGETLRPHSIAGFGNNTETSCILPAGVTSVHYGLPKSKLQKYAKQKGYDSFLELCEKTNSIELHQTQSILLRNCLQNILSNNILAVHGIEDLLKILKRDQKVKPIKIRTRYRVAHEFLRWCHHHTTGEPPHLEEISKDLFVSRRTLIQSVQENFQRGPAEIHKMIRLQHCNHLLMKAKKEGTKDNFIGSNSVNDIMHIHGFRHRGAFAQSFKKQFGYMPSAALNPKKVGVEHLDN